MPIPASDCVIISGWFSKKQLEHRLEPFFESDLGNDLGSFENNSASHFVNYFLVISWVSRLNTFKLSSGLQNEYRVLPVEV